MSTDGADLNTLAPYLFGAGGVVAWFREWRKGRKDAGAFALELIERQNSRIDELLSKVGNLEGKLEALSDRKAELEARLAAKNAEVTVLREEIERLKASPPAS